jgi:hypothetical protein
MQARNYGRVMPEYWTGRTGQRIQKHGPEAVVVGAYLMSSPHSTMLGLYHLPLLYIAEETGLGFEGASKGLQGCIDAGFCSYDHGTRFVWVHEMARFQIADHLEATDKRVKWVQRLYDTLPENPFLTPFYEHHHHAFRLTSRRVFSPESVSTTTSPIEGASMPHASPFEGASKVAPPKAVSKGVSKGAKKAGASKGHQRGIDARSSSSTRSSKPSLRHISSLEVSLEPHAEKPARGTRLPTGWVLPLPWGHWAMTECGFDEHRVREIAVTFADYWHAVAGAKGVKLDWLATWRNWCRKERDYIAQGNGHRANGAAYDERSRDRKQAFAELTGEASGDDIPPADVVDVEAREVSRDAITKH